MLKIKEIYKNLDFLEKMRNFRFLFKNERILTYSPNLHEPFNSKFLHSSVFIFFRYSAVNMRFSSFDKKFLRFGLTLKIN